MNIGDILNFISNRVLDPVLEKISVFFADPSNVTAFVAVCISIATARKQNQITLFERRYEVYSVVKRIVAIGKQLLIRGNISQDEALKMILISMGWYQSSVDTNSKDNGFKVNEDRVEELRFNIDVMLMQTSNLFSPEVDCVVEELLAEFKKLLDTYLYEGTATWNTRDGFTNYCSGSPMKHALRSMELSLTMGGILTGPKFFFECRKVAKELKKEKNKPKPNKLATEEPAAETNEDEQLMGVEDL